MRTLYIKILQKIYNQSKKILENHYQFRSNYKMQGMQQDRMYSNQDLSNFQSEGQSMMESPLPLQNQRQEDLQLLIRAHEKIRNLQQENFRLIQQKQSMKFDLLEEKQKSKNLSEENEKLRTQIDELYSRIGKFQKQFNCQYDLVTEQTQQKDVNRIRKFSHSSRKQSTDIQVNSYENIQPKEPSKRTQKQSNRSLKPSESTPVILNINVNTISKDQRQNFLSSCKEEFAQELQKMNQRESSIKKSLNRNRSEYFEINYQPRLNSQNKHGVSSFLKQAKKQFETQASRNLKNNCYVERNKSTSSGSLIKKNLSKDLLGDRTNYVNSKYASVNQIMSHNAAKNSYLTKNSNYHLRLGSAHDYSSIQRHNGEISKNIYCSKDKRTDVIDRKKKQFEMDLRNQNSGFIKYRGLCL